VIPCPNPCLLEAALGATWDLDAFQRPLSIDCRARARADAGMRARLVASRRLVPGCVEAAAERAAAERAEAERAEAERAEAERETGTPDAQTPSASTLRKYFTEACE